jgi:hypothetical protein
MTVTQLVAAALWGTITRHLVRRWRQTVLGE